MSMPELTIGVEEEYQIVHPETRALHSYIQEFLDQGKVILRDQIKPEFLQSQVEVGSAICRDIHQARKEFVRLRTTVCKLAEEQRMRVAAAGTHPFSKWSDQKITAGERYTKHEKNMEDIARRMLVFGMHVHIGVADPDLRIDVMNQARYFVPHFLALSTSSPFWHGRQTGLKSYRTIIMNDLPRAGLPPHFSSFSEFERFVDTLIQTNCIDEPTKIWWDMRPHPKFPTIEFRFTDICTKIDEAVCLTALIQALVAKLIQLRRNNIVWRPYRRNLITENKWRAVRHGKDGVLIDLGSRKEVAYKDLMIEMLDWLDDVLDEYGLRDDVNYVHTILEQGTSADRQLAVFEKAGSLEAVVDQVIKETREGCDL
jgi:carboxylate-amine ligase